MSESSQIFEQGQLKKTFGNSAVWAADQGETHEQHAERVAIDYGRDASKSAENAGQRERNVTNEAAKEDALTKEKKKNDTYMHILHMQEQYRALDEAGERIDGIIGKIKDNDQTIKNGIKLLKEDDIEGMVILLDEQGRYQEGMSDREVRKATKDIVGDKIEEQKDLVRVLEKELQDFEAKVEGLDKNSPEYIKYKAQLDDKRAELRELSEGIDKLNYDEAEEYLREYNTENFSVLRKENDVKKEANNDIEGESIESLSASEEFKELNDKAEVESYKSAFPALEDKLAGEFNAAATMEEIDLDSELALELNENDLETETTTAPNTNNFKLG